MSISPLRSGMPLWTTFSTKKRILPQSGEAELHSDRIFTREAGVSGARPGKVEAFHFVTMFILTAVFNREPGRKCGARPGKVDVFHFVTMFVLSAFLPGNPA